MTSEIFIDSILESNTPGDLLQVLERAYPQGRIRHFFKLNLPLSDARVRTVLEILAGREWEPRTIATPEGIRERVFTASIHRHYISEELDMFECLRFQPTEYLYSRDVGGRPVYDNAGPYRDQTANVGRIQLEPQFLRTKLDFASAQITGLWPVIPNRVKKLLESAKLRHVVFRPTILVRRDRRSHATTTLDWKTHGEPWWELGSDLRLSPRLPSPTPPDAKLTVDQILEGRDLPDSLYAQPEYRYRASDLEASEAFDLAHMHEGWENLPHLHERPLIASNKFYRFCVEHGLKAGWVPVHVVR